MNAGKTPRCMTQRAVWLHALSYSVELDPTLYVSVNFGFLKTFIFLLHAVTYSVESLISFSLKNKKNKSTWAPVSRRYSVANFFFVLICVIQCKVQFCTETNSAEFSRKFFVKSALKHFFANISAKTKLFAKPFSPDNHGLGSIN